MSNKSLYDIHNEFVTELFKRGESILMPTKGRPMGGTPLGYVKNVDNPPAGYIYMNRYGKYELHYDHLQTSYTSIDWKDIGLCDARCLYEWRETDANIKLGDYKDTIMEYKMPENFRWKIECPECNIATDADGHNSMSCMDAWLSGHIGALGHTYYNLKIYGPEIDEIKKMIKENRNNIDIENIKNVTISKSTAKNEWDVLDDINSRKIATFYTGDLAKFFVEKCLGMELDKNRYGVWIKKNKEK